MEAVLLEVPGGLSQERLDRCVAFLTAAVRSYEARRDDPEVETRGGDFAPLGEDEIDLLVESLTSVQLSLT